MHREDDDQPPNVELIDERDRDLVQQLRALPPEGTEPDWQKLEAAIRAEVGDAAPRPWWRNWRWIVPVWALATTAVVTILVTRGPSQTPEQPAVSHAPPQHVVPAIAEPVHTPTSTLWLDGQPVDIDDIDDATLDSLDEAARSALDGDDGDVSAGLLPVGDLGWLDRLDDPSIDRVEQWLARKKS